MYNPIRTTCLITAEGYKKISQSGLAQAIQTAEWLEKIGYKNVKVNGKTPEFWRKNL